MGAGITQLREEGATTASQLSDPSEAAGAQCVSIPLEGVQVVGARLPDLSDHLSEEVFLP